MTITNNTTPTAAVSANQPPSGIILNPGSASGSSPASAPADTVQLSTTAQVTAMYTQGLSVPEIAASMGLTAQQVDSYLGISTS